MEDMAYSTEELARAVEKWRGQNRKGFLELCILRCVRARKRVYGFALMDQLQQLGMEISEGSLYPLLARLVKEHSLLAEWDTPTEGHPRKYYTLSLFGLDFLAQIEEHYEHDHQVFLKIQDGGSDT
ncbi:MAG: PadR family transcriptional regulator [Spirochaetes bacterium]|nr:PadR family transcriptional regulator [Spirochaetota bacterium]MBU0954686.1 PadR family transcriptional regulator [Spirochaetota bacterium]